MAAAAAAVERRCVTVARRCYIGCVLFHRTGSNQVLYLFIYLFIYLFV